MDSAQPSLKNIAKIALAAMGMLFILGIITYKERVLFADASFIVFHIINEKNLAIQRFRFGSFITHLFPYLGQKFHLPLRALLMGYGVSFYLFFLSVVAVLVYVLKQYKLAILMALCYFLFVSESFIWVDELQQGIAWMFLLLGITIHLGERKANIGLLVLQFICLAAITFFTHFVIIIPFCFLWAYFIIGKKNWPFSKNVSILLGSFVVCVIITKFILTGGQSGSESHDLYGITHCSLKDIIHAVRKPVVKMFFYDCIVNYWPGVLVFIIGIATLLKNKEKALAAWTVVSVLGYIIIMGLAFGDNNYDPRLFHIESEWSAIGILVATPFVFAFLPKLKTTTAAWLLTGIFVVRLIYIISFLPPFSARNEMKEQVLKQMRKKAITKLALVSDPHLRSVTILDWALPYESILMSSLDGDKQQLVFLLVDPGDKQTFDILKHPTGFYDVWGVLPWNTINKEYYNLDTTKPYQIMTYAEFLK